jgi:adenine deaminase
MSTEANLNDPELRASAVKAARGHQPFDLLIENTVVLDMVIGRERQADIGMVGALIASVHPSDPSRDAIARIDADGAYAVPGLIDTHMHIESSMITPAEYSNAVVPRGVTTVVWDPHEYANACGDAGMEFALQAVRNLPLRVLTLAPTCVPSAPGFEFSGGDFGPETIASLLARDDIHGAAELMTMQPLLNGSPRVTGIVNAGLASGKRVCGHGRGLTGGDLAAYAASGVETDHELTCAADLIARLEAGMTVELRGSHEHLLPEFAEALLALEQLPQTLTLCTDDVFPDTLLNNGGLDRVVRMLIGHGLPPLWAYRAATFNAATRIGRRDLGLVAPGKRADILLLRDLENVKADTVIVDGKIAASDGALSQGPCVPTVTGGLANSIQTPPITASSFEVSATGTSARIATLSKPRFPEWGERDVPVKDGHLVLPDDMIRMAIINRYGKNTPMRVAFLENWGDWQGAFATTVSHDSHNLTIFGRDPEDMAAAANAVRDAQGGLAVSHRGEVVAKIDLPIAGLVSNKPLAVVAQTFVDVREALDRLVDWQPPYLVFKALFGASLVCNPGPRLSDAGLVEVFEQRVLEYCVLNSKS